MGYFLTFLFLIAVGFVLGFSEFLVTVVPEPLLLIGFALGLTFLIRAIVKAVKN